MAPSQTVQAKGAKKLLKRCYSLASWQENTGSYELAIQREINGQVSTWLHSHLQIGSVIKALPPKGSFVINAKQAKHTVLVAGGIGITPLRAMVHRFIAEITNAATTKKTMSLFYSAKTATEMCYLDEFTQLAQEYVSFSFYPFLSKPENTHSEPRWHGSIGRLNAEQLTQKLELASNSPKSLGIKPIDKTTCHYYMCGPNAMMDEVKHGLIQQGIAEVNIHFERFGVSNDTIGNDKFTVKLGGNVSIEFQKQRTLLDAMEEQGIEIESECRTGECGQCKVKVQQGKIKHLIDSDVSLNDDEILTCCTVPTSDLLIEV
jgi:ferredoxin-NADP reductase